MGGVKVVILNKECIERLYGMKQKEAARLMGVVGLGDPNYFCNVFFLREW